MMDAFDINVKLEKETTELFVVPFEIPEGDNTAGYLLVLNNLTLGSIEMRPDCKWVTEDVMPWNDEDLQRIGDEVAHHLLLSIS
jgi:hypothetical protein